MFDGHMFGVGGGFMWLFWLILIVALIWVIMAGINGGGRQNKSPLELAQERYAKGEISREEFEQIRKDIQAN